MKEKYILFIDSGIGGISILDYFLKQKRDINIIYYADTSNFPYGGKDEKTIGNILYKIYEGLSGKYCISMIVIVCNTASVSALNILRDKIDIPIIGTVPAIKPASKFTKNNRIGIIATELTVKGTYLTNLVKQFASGKDVYIKASKKFADAVEYNYSDESIRELIRKDLTYFKEKDIDVLVLGCTHYSFLYEKINDFFEGKVRIIDSKEGISKRIFQLMHDNLNSRNGKRILYLSKGEDGIHERYKLFNSKFKIFKDIVIEDLSCLKV